MALILAVNPGSTSTKIACFNDTEKFFEKNIPFPDEERKSFKNVTDQLERRVEMITQALTEEGIEPSSFDASVGRGGLLAPIPSGTYIVGEEMKEYLKKAPRGEHASNLGAFIAEHFAKLSHCGAYIVDPVSVDEMSDEARISGAPEIERVSLVHALNHKAVARRAAAKLGKKYEECRLIVAHLGSGVTLAVHRFGKMTDVSGAKSDGPMSPERAGGLPPDGLIELCFSGRYTGEELRAKLLSGWGLVSYLGTRDLREAFKMAESDPKAKIIMDAFVYQIAKGIGEFAAVLDGEVDAIVFTGGMAHSERFVEMISKKVRFIGRIEVFPGEDELAALAEGALRVIKGEEYAKEYSYK